MKFFTFGFFLLLLPLSGALAQTLADPQDRLPVPAPTPTTKKSGPDAQAQQGPTIIDSEAMDYDEKTRIAVFTGDYYGVYVKSPSFTVYCDKLTAHMRKSTGAPPIPGKKGPPIAPVPKGKGTAAGAAAPKSNGLESALAEGTPDRPVVIVQDKPAAPGQQPEHDVGIALKADYSADTGDVYLTGWPRVSQGVNTQIATSPRTVMIMNRDSHKMRTIGPSRTVIIQSDQAQTPGSKSSPAQDSTPAQ